MNCGSFPTVTPAHHVPMERGFSEIQMLEIEPTLFGAKLRAIYKGKSALVDLDLLNEIGGGVHGVWLSVGKLRYLSRD